MNTTAKISSDKYRPYAGIGINPARSRPQRHGLAGELVISADNHLALGGEDFFYNAAPERLKARVPRITWDQKKGHWDMLLFGKSLWPFGSEELVFAMEGRTGAWNVDEHVKDMAAEGIASSVAFPNLIPSMFKHGDYEAREFIMYQYNKYLSRLQQRQPGRFYGAAIPNFWDPQHAASWVKEMKADGLRVAMMPLSPGNYPNGEGIYYADDKFDPMWEALADNNIAVAFHIGENYGLKGRAGFEAAALGAVGGLEFRHTWGRLTFGGVFDRFPTLRVEFAEANIHWVPGMLQDSDMMPECMGAGIWLNKPKRRASDYWYSNCYAGFMYDVAGLRLIDLVGVENAMWAADYSHNEGTYGYSGDAIQTIIDIVGKDDARKIYGGNALKFLGYPDLKEATDSVADLHN